MLTVELYYRLCLPIIPMNFCSDNATGVAPEIMAAIAAANCGAVMSYGDDEYTERLQVKFSDLFETSVTVFPVATGSLLML